MPRKRTAESTRDRVSIRDEWHRRGKKTGGRWLYRVWDSAAGKYAGRTFSDDPERDANRKTPGCAAGDEWANLKGARFHLKLDTAASVTLREVGERYPEARQLFMAAKIRYQRRREQEQSEARKAQRLADSDKITEGKSLVPENSSADKE